MNYLDFSAFFASAWFPNLSPPLSWNRTYHVSQAEKQVQWLIHKWFLVAINIRRKEFFENLSVSWRAESASFNCSLLRVLASSWADCVTKTWLFSFCSSISISSLSSLCRSASLFSRPNCRETWMYLMFSSVPLTSIEYAETWEKTKAKEQAYTHLALQSIDGAL